MGSLLLSPGSWGTQDLCVCALLEWSLCFPWSSGSPVIKSCWPSKSASLETSSPFAGYPGWEAWHRAQNLYNSGRTSLVILFSNLWVSHLVGMGFDLIMIVPLLQSCCGFSFVFGYGVSFFGGFQHLPVDGWSTASCSFGALTGGLEHPSFYSAILNQSPSCIFFRKVLEDVLYLSLCI